MFPNYLLQSVYLRRYLNHKYNTHLWMPLSVSRIWE